MSAAPLGWWGIVRLGLVQTSIGAIVVLTTSTLNRVMVVELALPAVVPGFLVAIHYAVQALRPRWGYGSDVGGRLTQWIIGGMAMLALGGILAAVATAWMSTAMIAGLVLAFLAFLLIGIGVGACGTCLLVLLAKRVDPRRRVPAATIVWLMMIGGFAVTATIAGHNLDPYTPLRLVIVTSIVSIAALLITIAAIWKVEGPATAPVPLAHNADTKPAFRDALLQVWSEPQARRFTIFVFISMLAYSAQELILEPYAGLVFGLTPGQSTKLSGLQHGGVFVGMIVIALIGSFGGGFRSEASRRWAAGGCAASALALAFIATASVAGPAWPLREAVFALGFANGNICCCSHRLDDGDGQRWPFRAPRACAWACGVPRKALHLARADCLAPSHPMLRATLWAHRSRPIPPSFWAKPSCSWCLQVSP